MILAAVKHGDSLAATTAMMVTLLAIILVLMVVGAVLDRRHP